MNKVASYPVGTNIIMTDDRWGKQGLTGVVSAVDSNGGMSIEWCNGRDKNITYYARELASHRIEPACRTTEGPAQEYAILMAAQEALSCS